MDTIRVSKTYAGIGYVSSLAKAGELIASGGTILIERGSIWHEMLTITAPNVTIAPFGNGPNPLIDGDGERHGILVRAPNAVINTIDVTNAVNGLYVTESLASGTVKGGRYSYCGTGLVAGGSGTLTMAWDVECCHSTKALGAGDGIQISEDASIGPHNILRAVCSDNRMQGINHKIGICNVHACCCERNGETGVLAQVHAARLNLSKSVLQDNNTADNGTFNMGIENDAQIWSTMNLFANPRPGNLLCNNVNLSGESMLRSRADVFLESISHPNIGAGIRTNTGGNSAFLNVQRGAFYSDSLTGICVDAYGAVGLDLVLAHCAFATLKTRILRYPPGIDLGIDYNAYHRADGGEIVEIQDLRHYTMADLNRLCTAEGTDSFSTTDNNWDCFDMSLWGTN